MLHAHQRDLVSRVYAEWRAGKRCVLLQAATGLGKTHLSASIINDAVAKGARVIFAAHLDTLITDTSARLTGFGIEHGIVQASRKANASAPVQVASLMTLHRRPECRPAADLIIIDECRRAMAASVRGVLDAYPRARLLGLDATPERATGEPLGDIFESMVCGPSTKWLTQNGYLVPCVVLSPPTVIDGTLALDPVEAYEKHAPGTRAIVFCKDVEHARDVVARFRVAAALVTGETSRADREAARASLAAGVLRVIVNVDVYRDGADLPSLETVIIGRHMGVASAFLQACGRGMRTSPGKSKCTIIDLSGAAIAFGLPEDERVWSLTGAACRRTGEALVALARCRACLAVFHSGPAACPRCGASLRGCKVKRRATRVERQELTRLDTRPESVRDEIAVRGIMNRLRMRRPDWSDAKLANAARFINAKQKRKRKVAA